MNRKKIEFPKNNKIKAKSKVRMFLSKSKPKISAKHKVLYFQHGKYQRNYSPNAPKN